MLYLTKSIDIIYPLRIFGVFMANKIVSDEVCSLEELNNKLNTLRTHLQEGNKQAERGEFVTQSLYAMLTQFKNG